MASMPADVLTSAQQSLAAACARDRAAWLALFGATGCIEDPVGSRPHRGPDEIRRFYDTFIGPREMTFDTHADLVFGSTVWRDLDLVVTMAAGVTLRIPAYLRYDLTPRGDQFDLTRLRAYWEMPSMVGQFVRQGPRALPAGARLTATLLRNQGIAGAAGFLGGLRTVRRPARSGFGDLLDGLCAGDETAVRRSRIGAVSAGDDEPMAASELLGRLTGSRWRKMIGAGGSLVAALDPGPALLVAEVAAPFEVRRLQYFAE
jgi:hypothetical protein